MRLLFGGIYATWVTHSYTQSIMMNVNVLITLSKTPLVKDFVTLLVVGPIEKRVKTDVSIHSVGSNGRGYFGPRANVTFTQSICVIYPLYERLN